MKFNPLLLSLFTLTFLLGNSVVADKLEDYTGTVFFRYINEEGVKVINSVIPAKYTVNGYEIVTPSGEVLKVIPPPPSKEEVKELEVRRKMLARYEVLKRRYSSVESIQGSKKRRLENINTNLSILKGNISGLTNKQRDLMQKAANEERQNGKASKSTLKQLDDIQTEITVAEKILKIREKEYLEEEARFNRDITAFINGQALMREKKNKN